MNTLDTIPNGMGGNARPAKRDDLADDRQAWMWIGATFHKGSPHCEECSYCEHKGELTTVWDGSAMEHWTECALGKLPGDKPTECPAYQSFLAEQVEAE